MSEYSGPLNGKTKLIVSLLTTLILGVGGISAAVWKEQRELDRELEARVERATDEHAEFKANDAAQEAQYEEILRRLERIERRLDGAHK